MLSFEYVVAEDDLAVLAAYVAAQEETEAARKLQEKKSGPANATASDQTAARPAVCVDDTAEGGMDEEEVTDSTATPQESLRRTHTWLSRLRAVDGIPADSMAPIHGRLIAHGLLKFQLQGREEGLVYRVTGAGRKALAAPAIESEAA